jgi:hypothetical protein
VALLGVIALMGMIQRNSVILIDQIEQDRARGVPAWDAIVESAVRRLRPIVLTAAAAVLAMIPLSRSVFWGPHGRGHHGRADRGHGADAAGPAGHVCRLVPGAPAGSRGGMNAWQTASHIRVKSRLTDFTQAAAQFAACLFVRTARVAKLVDAPGLGPDASNGVGVRVPPRAPPL